MNDQSGGPVRVDLHCHSAASDLDCATPPREVYELAKRSGMDFVTITDHNTIAGVLELSDEPDVFLSEELTAWFKNEPHAVHILCFGITPDDHGWLRAHSADVVACAEHLHEREIACALAHPFSHVAAPLTPAHRRTLAELFPAWETRNGKRPTELNAPAAIYIDTHGGIAVGGSDDHAGVDIGRTYTEAPFAASTTELLEHVRSGRVSPHGTQGSPAKSAHSALVLAARRLAGGHGSEEERLVLQAWLAETELGLDAGALLGMLQGHDSSHCDLERRARRVHERRLAAATEELIDAIGTASLPDAVARISSACAPAIPYVRAAADQAREQAQLSGPEAAALRVAIITDGVGAMHGVAHTLEQLRERAIAGHEIDVIGTDANVDRRLSAVTEIGLPFDPGLKLGVPSVFAVTDALTARPYDLVHVCAPGPAGIAALLVARVIGVPVAASWHTELQAYAGAWAYAGGGEGGQRAYADASAGGQPAERAEQAVSTMLAPFYSRCQVVLSPSRCADAGIERLGIGCERIFRWVPGVDLARFNPARHAPNLLPAAFNILYAGRLGREHGTELLVEAFLTARDREPRLHLVLAGGGPDEDRMRARLGQAATFLGWLAGDVLASVYASADLFVLPGTTDTFGAAVLQAQASGLPVLAVDAGGPAELIENGRSGCLVDPETQALAGAIRGLARRGAIRERLATGGLLAVREHSWERSLDRLAEGYALAIGDAYAGQGLTSGASATATATATAPARGRIPQAARAA